MEYQHNYNSPDRFVGGKWLRTYSSIPYVVEHSRSYGIWLNINKRCRDTKYRAVNQFKDYQEFAEWCSTQINYLESERGKYYAIDKDIVEPFNKEYRPDYCVFIPQSLNSILTFNSSQRGCLPLGVSEFRGKFKSECSGNYLGLFNDPFEAHRAWQKEKINQLASAINTYSFLNNSKIFTGLQKHIDLIDNDLKGGQETKR